MNMISDIKEMSIPISNSNMVDGPKFLEDVELYSMVKCCILEV